MVVEGFVDAGNGLDLLQHRADVVADENNGAILVYLCQQFVEAGFETLVDVCAGLAEITTCGSEMMARPRRARCNCPPLKAPMARCSMPSSPMRAITAEAFSRCRAVKREASGFLLLSPEG